MYQDQRNSWRERLLVKDEYIRRLTQEMNEAAAAHAQLIRFLGQLVASEPRVQQRILDSGLLGEHAAAFEDPGLAVPDDPLAAALRREDLGALEAPGDGDSTGPGPRALLRSLLQTSASDTAQESWYVDHCQRCTGARIDV